MNMPEDDEDGLLSDLEGEVHVMRALNHPNIVRYIGCERDEEYYNKLQERLKSEHNLLDFVS